jgi:hypothetical protein
MKNDVAPYVLAEPLSTIQHNPLLLYWQQLTQQANQYFRQEQSTAAYPLYQQAMTLAEQLLQQPLQDSTLAALVISRHNLADCYLQMAQPLDAAIELCQAWQQLQHCAARLPLSQQPMLLPHLQRCRLELQAFLQQQGEHPAIRALLEQPPLTLTLH